MSDAPQPRAFQAGTELRRMAGVAETNASNGFAGVFVIVPPGDGDPQSMLLLDNAESPAVFWSLLQTRAQMALRDIEDAERGATFGGRR